MKQDQRNRLIKRRLMALEDSRYTFFFEKWLCVGSVTKVKIRLQGSRFKEAISLTVADS